MSQWITPFVQYGPYLPLPQWNSMPFPIFQEAVNETEQATQAPVKMVAHCAANAVFSAVQSLGDLLRPDGGVAPLTNISLIIGETGERKSTVDACFFEEMYKFRDAQAKVSEKAGIEHRVRMKVWQFEEKMLDRHLAASLAGDGVDRKRLMSAMEEHMRHQPKRAANATFLYQDTSLTSLKLGLASFPSACVHSTEGMSILKGALFDEKNLLCSLYSGEPHLYDRMGKSIALTDKRLCVSAHSQPKRTMGFFAKMGDEFRDSGLAARMTVCLLESTQGFRTHDAIEIPTTYRDRFNERIRYLLQISARAAQRSGFRRRKITFSPHVARAYLEHATWIENQMRPNGKFGQARDYANRLADKIGRLSAAIHLFEDFEGDISLDTFFAARAFYTEETNDFLFLFNYLPSDQCLADQLVKWLQQQPVNFGQIGHKKSYIQQRGPLGLRKKAVLDPVLGLLEQHGTLHLRTFNSAVYVCPGPNVPYVVAQPLQSIGVR